MAPEGEHGFIDPVAAHAELRRRLDGAREAQRLTKARLASRAAVSRTVVSEALNSSERVPSRETVRALATALGLAPEPLIALRDAAAPSRPPARSAPPAPGPVEEENPPRPAEYTANTVDGNVWGGTVVMGANVTLSLPHPGRGHAVEEAAPTAAALPGRPIGECDPHDLEIHPAIDPPRRPGATGALPQRGAALLPGYVRRAHDEELDQIVAAAADGRSRMAVLVGSSSTGKTRACWEAVQPLAALGWRLWHPVDPTRAEAALAALDRIAARTVVWLNEAQHYLGAGGGVGERVAAALHTLLTDPGRAPVLVLGTLWEEYAETYAKRPDMEEDPHAQVRALLEGRQVAVPVDFDQAALDAARGQAAAGDAQLAHALEYTDNARLTQTLAGALRGHSDSGQRPNGLIYAVDRNSRCASYTSAGVLYPIAE